METEFLAIWPLPRPRTWRPHGNKPQTESETREFGIASGEVRLPATQNGSANQRLGSTLRLRLGAEVDQ